MVTRRVRIPIWLGAAALLATFVIGSSAGPVVLRDVQPAFRIVTRAVSDVITQDVTPELAVRLGMTRPTGVLVSDVVYSPLWPGDVILAINGNPVGCQIELDAQLAQIAPGETFLVEILRHGRTQTVAVQRAIETPIVLQGTVESRGITVASLSTEDGVIVTKVQIGTPASDFGLKRGDIILDVDEHPVRTAGEFLGYMRQLNNHYATFNVRHSNGQVNVFAIPW